MKNDIKISIIQKIFVKSVFTSLYIYISIFILSFFKNELFLGELASSLLNKITYTHDLWIIEILIFIYLLIYETLLKKFKI